MKLKSNRSAATSFSIAIFVLLMVILILFSLYTFLTYRNKSYDLLYQGFEDIYVKEAEINHYINNGWSLEQIKSLNAKELEYYKSQGWNEDTIEKNFVFDIDIDREIAISKKYYGAGKTKAFMTVTYKFKPGA